MAETFLSLVTTRLQPGGGGGELEKPIVAVQVRGEDDRPSDAFLG